MATTKKKKTTRGRRNKKYFYIGGFKIKKTLFFVVISIVIILIGGIIWRNSYLWPWPSQDEIDQRLSDVVDACMYNEYSRACKSLTGKYNIEFEYCHALSDIPEIGKQIPVYGVAKLNSFKATSLDYVAPVMSEGAHAPGLLDSPVSARIKVREGQGEQGKGIYPYYGCADSIDEIDKTTDKSLITNPNTIALFGLSKIPQYSETYKSSGCTFHYADINNLWKQIPNISTIKNEGETIFKMYRKCSQRADSERSIKNLNNKISGYAKSYSVQLFFKKYDEWNTRSNVSCSWYDKSFPQRCGAGSDGSANSAGLGSMVKDFASEMQQHLDSNYFTSRVVVNN